MAKKTKGLKTLLAESYRFYNKHSLSFFKIAAIAFIPLMIIDRLFYMRLRLEDIPGAYLADSPVFLRGHAFSLGQFILLTLAAFAVTVVIFLFYQIALFKNIQKIEKGEKPSAIAAYKQAWNIFRPYCVVISLVAFWVSVWGLLFVIPGFIFVCLYSFAIFALIFDGKEGKQALAYSKKIVKNNIKKYIGNVSAMLTITLMLYLLIIVILENTFKVHWSCYYTVSSFTGELLQDLTTIIVSIYPLIFFYFLYNELKRQV